MRKFYLASSIILLFPFFGFAGKYDNILAAEPPHVKWQEIETQHFRLIFPANFTAEAKKLANRLELAYPIVSYDFSKKPRKIDLIIHTQTTIPNGMVSFFPRRSEFLSSPMQEINLDWFDILSIHEFRHIAQDEAIQHGLTSWFSWLFGDMATIPAVITIPSWLWEGDATFMETIFSHTGRGRTPSFISPVKALLLEKGIKSYDSMILTSYRYPYPGPYQLGYYLTSYMRYNFGSDIVEDFYRQSGAVPLSPLAFSVISKLNTKRNIDNLYKDAMKFHQTRWAEEMKTLELTEYNRLTPETKTYTDYILPLYLSDGSLVALKSSLSREMHFVTINTAGKESYLAPAGMLHNGNICLHNDKLYFSEYQPHPRWQWQDYSVVYCLDGKSGKTQKLTDKTRYFSPVVSPDGSKIAVIEVPDTNIFRILLLDKNNMKVIKTLNNPNNDFLSSLIFINDSLIAMVALTKTGKVIRSYNLNTEVATDYSGINYEDINYLVAHNGLLYYDSSYSGIDNIYALNLETNERFRITSSKYGAYYPTFSPDGSQLTYAEYTVDGNCLVTVELPTVLEPISEVPPMSDPILDSLVVQEKGYAIMDVIPEMQHEVKPYSRWQNLFHIYGWSPIVSLDMENIGLQVTSQDPLNTMEFSAGYSYQRIEKGHSYFLSSSLHSLFPIIDFKLQSYLDIDEDEETDSTTVDEDKMYENSVELTFRFPLSFTNRNHFYNLYGGITTSNIRLSDVPYEFSLTSSAKTESFFTNEYFFSLSHNTMGARRDLYPKWYQDISVSYQHSLSPSYLGGYAFDIRSQLFFPGIWEDHSTNLTFAYEQLDQRDYDFRNTIRYPRGYDWKDSDEILLCSFNYAFPVFYPDWRLGSLVYLPRIWGNLFTDAGFAKLDDVQTDMLSLGGELNFDLMPLRLPVSFTVGLRYAYIPDTKESEFVFDLMDGSF